MQNFGESEGHCDSCGKYTLLKRVDNVDLCAPCYSRDQIIVERDALKAEVDRLRKILKDFMLGMEITQPMSVARNHEMVEVYEAAEEYGLSSK